MTHEEAKEILKVFQADDFMMLTSSRFDEAVKLAIEAMELRVAKKPIKEKISVTGVVEGIVYACPLCGTYVAYSDENDNHGYQREYCGKCGQKIDLEVE